MRLFKIASDFRGFFRGVVYAIRDTLTTSCVRGLRGLFEMDIGADKKISLRAHVDLTNPHRVHIGDRKVIASRASIIAD